MQPLEGICESCRLDPAQTLVESEAKEQPYRLCPQCAYRLQKRSLRPLEWFNLASLHSPYSYFLHDDFYSENGEAKQPEEDVIDPEKYPAPTLKDVANDTERLIDFAMAQFLLKEQVVEALKRHNRDKILESLQTRVLTIHNVNIECCAYDICAEVLKESAAPWIRERWKATKISSTLFSVAKASVKCLLLNEGFDLVVWGLDQIPLKEIPHVCNVLDWFRSEKSLDWIESHVDYPITENWGRLAAVSQISWQRVVNWLDMGRPISLVAIDSLYCIKRDSNLLKMYSPKLLQPDAIELMTKKLEQYATTDSVPRVECRVGVITNQWNQIL